MSSGGLSSSFKKRRARDQRGSAASRGYGAGWDKFRKAIIADHIAERGLVCACGCGEPLRLGDPGHPDNAEVDHIVPHKGDQAMFWDRRNLWVLRKSCHSAKTNREQSPAPKDEPLRFGADGEPLMPPAHWR